MPGPQRWYATNAARQRAYRQRQREARASEWAEEERAVTFAYVLQAAVQQARRQGDPVAAQVYRPDPIELLRALADHFYDRAGTPAAERPWRPTPPTALDGDRTGTGPAGRKEGADPP